MLDKFRERFFASPAPTPSAPAIGRPRTIEGEKMVVGNSVLASMMLPRDGGVYFLSVDDIVARKGWATYKEMLNDDQVKAVLEFKKVLVAGRKWEISPGDQSDDGKKQADFAMDNLYRVNIDQVFRNALSAFEFGYSLAEIVFERAKWDGDSQQHVMLKKLAHRDPRELQLKMDFNGNFIGARQVGVIGASSNNNIIELPKEKLWLHTHDKRFDNLYGNPDLRAAYRSWYAKKFVMQFWNVYLERFGAPMTKMTYPLGASDQLKANLKSILMNLASKTEILVPQGVEVNLIEATRGGNAGYADALAFHNNSIARAMLMVALLGADGDANRQTASDSQSYLHLRILFKMADEISQQLASDMMKQVIYPLIDLNFAKPVYPKFVWQDYGQFEGMKVADEIRQLHVAGIIDMDQTDVNYVRSVLGLPIRSDEDEPDEVIRPAPMPSPGGGTVPPAAEQGNDRAGKGTASKKTPDQKAQKQAENGS